MSRKIIQYLKSFGGHIANLYNIINLNFGFKNPNSYTKFRIINQIRKKTRANMLIETGTYLGVNAERCSKVFDKVYTIELDKVLAKNAQNHFSNNKKIEVFWGDAQKLLPGLLEKNEITNAVIFLDAHFSGGPTARGVLPEPAIEELKIISNFQEKIKAIIIDDFRCFGSEPDFPSKSDLIKAVENYFLPLGFQMTVFLDLLIIARPPYV